MNERLLGVQGKEAAFRIHYWGINPVHYDNPVHRHSFFELCYVLDGEGEYTDDGNEYRLSKGTLFISRPGIWHQIRSRSGFYLAWAAFELMDEHSSQAWHERYKALAAFTDIVRAGGDELTAGLAWRALIKQASQAAAGGIGHEEAAEALAFALLAALPETFGLDAPESERKPVAAARSASMLLRRAELYIRDNLVRPLLLEEVAGFLHISARHLSRVFAAELGVTFGNYVRSARVHKAGQLLLTTADSIKEIAEKTGFGSVHYFTRVFKEETGQTPARYRRSADVAGEAPDSRA